MEHLETLDRTLLKQVKFILTDVDDTITTHGRLLPETLAALYSLQDAGIRIIPVTGGSAGWSDTYLRQWPIDSVITESGALAFYTESDGSRGIYHHPSIEREGYRERADRLIGRVLSEVPGSKLSSDQFCRIFDIAFDHHSEPPFLDQDGIARITDICGEVGASFGVSSIHVNCWFGSYNKLDMVKLFMQHRYGLGFDELIGQSVYCGDSTNDIPLFRAFPVSIGVGDLEGLGWEAEDLPAYGTELPGGRGFARFAEHLLA